MARISTTPPKGRNVSPSGSPTEKAPQITSNGRRGGGAPLPVGGAPPGPPGPPEDTTHPLLVDACRKMVGGRREVVVHVEVVCGGYTSVKAPIAICPKNKGMPLE